jgi:hypothetical protein
MDLDGLITATTTTATTTTAHGWGHLFIAGVFAATARRGKDGEETAHFFAMAFHADHIICMLVADEKFKFSSAVRAVIFIQGHRRFPPSDSWV